MSIPDGKYFLGFIFRGVTAGFAAYPLSQRLGEFVCAGIFVWRGLGDQVAAAEAAFNRFYFDQFRAVGTFSGVSLANPGSFHADDVWGCHDRSNNADQRRKEDRQEKKTEAGTAFAAGNYPGNDTEKQPENGDFQNSPIVPVLWGRVVIFLLRERW